MPFHAQCTLQLVRLTSAPRQEQIGYSTSNSQEDVVAAQRILIGLGGGCFGHAATAERATPLIGLMRWLLSLVCDRTTCEEPSVPNEGRLFPYIPAWITMMLPSLPD